MGRHRAALLLVVVSAGALAASLPASLEVSREVRARLDASVLEARLGEEGFALVAPAAARVRLVVTAHPRGVELTALHDDVTLVRVVEAPAEVWPIERTFELAQRLAGLAHEAAAAPAADARRAAPDEELVRAGGAQQAPAASGLRERGESPPRGAEGVPVPPGPEGRAESPPRSASVSSVPPPSLRKSETAPGGAEAPSAPPTLQQGHGAAPTAERFGLLVRAEALFQEAGVDPALWLLGAVHLGRLEPLFGAGLVAAAGPAGWAVEVPVLGGARVVFEPGDRWTLSPEALVGLKVHAFLAGDTAVRVDPVLRLGVSARHRLAQRLSLGVSVAALVSMARTHLAEARVLWQRGPLGFAVGVDVQL